MYTQEQILAKLLEIATAADPDDDWCGEVGNRVDGSDLPLLAVFSNWEDYGGASFDISHTYLKAEDGTIYDPTITQFVEKGSPEQKALLTGFPHHPDYPSIGIITPDHPLYQHYHAEWPKEWRRQG